MDSLPIPNADDSVLSQYPNISRLLVQISSSDAKRTAMVERISMFLRILKENTELETVANLMLRTSIQMSYLHAEILLAVGTMQRRMATYVEGNYEDQRLLHVMMTADATLAGTNSDLQKLETNFSELQASISLVTLSNPSTPSVHTQTGSLEWIERLIFTIRTSRLILDNYISFGNGLGETYPPGIVSIAPCILGCSQSHSPPLRGGDFHDAEARRSPTVTGLAWRRQEEWAFTNLIIGVRGRSLLMWGRSRTGKTILGRSFGKHAYFGGLFSLEEFESSDDLEYAVFDDIQGGFKYFPGYKSWLGQQAEFYCTDKYRRKKHITWGKPCIWIMNEDPYTQEVDIDWLEANCLILHIKEPLF